MAEVRNARVDDPGAQGESENVALLRRLRAADALWAALRETQGTELSRQAKLRARFDDELVRAALRLEECRVRAQNKFRQAERMWFDRVGLEQATAEPVARHKAQRFQGAVWDLCCGIGGDALALAERCDVTAVDQSATQCLRTEWNAEAYGAVVTTKIAAVESLSLAGAIVHLDPDRRPAGRGRTVRIEESTPGMPFLESLISTARGGAIKLSPASNFPGKFPDAEIELISLAGECKEATVWFGDLGDPGVYRATVLPEGATIAAHPLDWVAPLAPIQHFLHDPDPAVVRAGLVDRVAVEEGMSRLDSAEEYLTSDEPKSSPFFQSFEVLESLPNSPKEIRNWFRRSAAGQVEIKCRHIPVQAEAVRRSLPLPGNEPVTLIFARVQGRARAVVCRRVKPR